MEYPHWRFYLAVMEDLNTVCRYVEPCRENLAPILWTCSAFSSPLVQKPTWSQNRFARRCLLPPRQIASQIIARC